MSENRTIRMDAVQMRSDGRRIDVPKRVRDEHDIFTGRLIQFALVIDGEREHFTARVNGGNRVTIPVRLREKHDIGPGDEIDIEVLVDG